MVVTIGHARILKEKRGVNPELKSTFNGVGLRKKYVIHSLEVILIRPETPKGTKSYLQVKVSSSDFENRKLVHMIVECPNCNGSVEVSAALAGQTITCPHPKCSGQFYLPQELFSSKAGSPPTVPKRTSSELRNAILITFSSVPVLIIGRLISRALIPIHPGDEVEKAMFELFGPAWLPFSAVYLLGCSLWSKAKGYSWIVGFLLGFFCFLIGLLVIMVLPDRRKESDS